jgi:hypothetical protein
MLIQTSSSFNASFPSSNVTISVADRVELSLLGHASSRAGPSTDDHFDYHIGIDSLRTFIQTRSRQQRNDNLHKLGHSGRFGFPLNYATDIVRSNNRFFEGELNYKR